MLASLLVGLVLGQSLPLPKYSAGAVVSDSMIASEVGRDILRQGGNAVDAAVATHFALAVTHPTAGNLGGGGFMLVRMADGRTVALDYRETAPAAATRDMYLGANGEPKPRASLDGPLASGVPGSVAGMGEAHRRFGSLPWARLVGPAQRLAARGFAVSRFFESDLHQEAKRLALDPEANRIFGAGLREGDTFRQPDLARTLLRLRDKGPREFYEGETARRLSAAMREDGGLITMDDLRNYRVIAREPLVGSYRGDEVVTMPPPSSGGIALLQMLGMLEATDVRASGFGTAATIHRTVEGMKRAFADRAEFLGDPDFAEVPVARLLDPAHIAAMRASIQANRATPAGEIRTGEGLREGEHTTHFTVVDKAGNVVACTTTLNTGYGSAYVPKGLGFLMNNEMDDFATVLGKPNGYGLMQGERNAIAPGKRPLSSMTPTVVLRDGKPYLVLGSPGGPTIINTVLQTIVNVVDHRMSVRQAVTAPRIHHQWMPDEVRYEEGAVNPDVRAALAALGHRFAARAANMGSCHAVLIEPGTGLRVAGVDPRLGDAGAAGY
ncbi:MAG: gamma-glutamyltransferase [Fimbriimonadaceae bacterium]|nr:gamma-glutamyltransferase [Fimbriimonadaceae bacterium]